MWRWYEELKLKSSVTERIDGDMDSVNDERVPTVGDLEIERESERMVFVWLADVDRDKETSLDSVRDLDGVLLLLLM